MASILKQERIEIKRLAVLNKFNSRCAYCGCQLNDYNFQVDHIIPRLREVSYANIPVGGRGSDDIHNLNPCCPSCNSSKSTQSLEQFREHIRDRVSRLNEHSSNYQIAKRFGLIKEADIKTPVVFYFETILTNAK